ncbi:MAG: ABC transporter permease [Brooklawnia sp.]|jgi:peptide/nickel transport system permease protein
MSIDARMMTLTKPAHPTRRTRFHAVGLMIATAALVLITGLGLAFTDAATTTDFARQAQPPSPAHPFGTDWFGRDLFARTLRGLSTSIMIGMLAAICSAVIAAVLGGLAAIGPRWLDNAISWLIDLMLGIPHLLLLILISFALGGGMLGVTIGIATTHWPSLARVIRGEIVQTRQSTYVAVARKLGHGPLHIARHHMAPTVFPQLIVGLVLLFPHAVLHEAAVTFLGFGLPPEQPAIGVILAESMSFLSAGMWWSALFPGLTLVLVVLLVDRIGGTLGAMLVSKR